MSFQGGSGRLGLGSPNITNRVFTKSTGPSGGTQNDGRCEGSGFEITRSGIVLKGLKFNLPNIFRTCDTITFIVSPWLGTIRQPLPVKTTLNRLLFIVIVVMVSDMIKVNLFCRYSFISWAFFSLFHLWNHWHLLVVLVCVQNGGRSSPWTAKILQKLLSCET